MNLLLSVAKFIFGNLINSRAILMDAWNGFSDMVSSVLSILSAAYASKRVDREHPLGFGRLEYVTSMFSTVFIVFMGLRGIYGAITDIIVPDDPPQYNTVVILLMVASLLAKISYGYFTRRAGKRIRAIGLIMTGTDAIGDALISVAILITILVYHLTEVDIENWVSILISLFIIKTGVEMLRECVSKLLGRRADPELQKRIRRLIASQRGVRNVFNLVIHNYGEDVWIGSVDIEVDEDMTAAEATKLSRRIRRLIASQRGVRNAFNLVIHNYGEDVWIGSVDIEVDEDMTAAEATKLSRRIIQKAAEQNIRLTSVGICGTNLNEAHNAELWDRILTHIEDHPEFIRAYAFSYDAEEHLAYFYVVPDVTIRKNKDAAVAKLRAELEEEFPDIVFSIDTSVEM